MRGWLVAILVLIQHTLISIITWWMTDQDKTTNDMGHFIKKHEIEKTTNSFYIIVAIKFKSIFFCKENINWIDK